MCPNVIDPQYNVVQYYVPLYNVAYFSCETLLICEEHVFLLFYQIGKQIALMSNQKTMVTMYISAAFIANFKHGVLPSLANGEMVFLFL